MPAIMTMLADHAARQLLDFSQKLDINLLDNVVNCLYHGEGAQQRMAQEVLTHLKEHPDAWTRVDTILEFSQNMNTKYYGLQILENVIKTRWKILPRNQCEGIKKYVVGLIIKTSSDPTCVEKEKVYIGKLNMILVQVSFYLIIIIFTITDFEEYPEHRTNFFLLLQAVNSHCFPAFLAIPPAQFKLVLDSIIWAFKHTMRNVADTGLQILFTLLQNVAQEEAAAQSFYQTYFCDILQHIFSVVTDTSHTAGLTMHASILAYMFNLVEEGKISTPLNPGNPVNNQMFIQEYVANLLKSAFPHLQDAQVKLFVTGLFSLNQDIPAFKEHLRDFLVQIKEFAGEDTSDLFLEERETALRQAQEEKHKLQMSVPGILNPHEIPEEMCD
ncbi:exportin-1 [Leptonychotes weddellii]|uniref:Exportin-1 n=1 Tax=Leptonychotes weddellii TaxID=9713 RepID=A0A2U3XP75_LEPWE|nr:exportin-1 [Leptonychotes weddellii]